MLDGWDQRFRAPPPSAEISPAIYVQRLARDVARAGAGEKTHGGSDILGRSQLAGQHVLALMMLRLRRAGLAGRVDQAGRDAIHRHAIRREIVRESARETDISGLGGHGMRYV